MARNWLTSNLLPSPYWYFAIKRACEVGNILPTLHIKNIITTPHELVFGSKADYRSLFPMFSLSYIKVPKRRQEDSNKWSSQTVKAIVVGRCPKSDGLLFYIPTSKQLISNGDGYKFDTSSPSGPHFNEKFDSSFYMSTRASFEAAIHRSPTYQSNEVVYVKNNDKVFQAHVLSVPINDDDEPYTLQYVDSGEIVQVLAEEILPSDPNANIPSSSSISHIKWIQDGAKVTLILPATNNQPKQGILKLSNDEWLFYPGRVRKHQPIPLPSFLENAESLLNNRKLFKGWITQSRAIAARSARATANVLSSLIVNGKVDAKTLDIKKAPTLLQHHKLSQNDRNIWDAAYMAEYQGLQNIQTWETISEEQYQKMKHLYKGLMPTMAITTIKKDGNGNPIRAKYRIVALGNLDNHEWTKQDCFAPVLSQLELRLLIAIAVSKGCIPKSGDITQAFCQSFLPKDEYYICTPPAGCFLTPSNTFLKLRKTLYGLKRSPRHFYDLACKLLKQLGMKAHPSSPCLFKGTIIKGQPPIYLGLYVDDFIYFSESSEVEKRFEKEFDKLISIDWNGEIDYFLGISFDCKKDKQRKVTIKMHQEAFVDHLLKLTNLDSDTINSATTPYRHGFPIDAIPKQEPSRNQDKLTHYMQRLVGSLNWLSISTRPDISTVTNMLAKYMASPNSHHIEAAKRVIRYLKGTKSRGIEFSTSKTSSLQTYIKFPTNDQVITLCDANWGPQDASKPKPNTNTTLDLFKSRSISGYVLWLYGPLHWQSKRQSITARSTAEAEIYATDESIKGLLHLDMLISGLGLKQELMPSPTPVYNDNAACIAWSHNMTTKGLRHIQIRENAVRESIHTGFAQIKHIAGAINIADLFTKEDKDDAHFISIRDILLSPP